MSNAGAHPYLEPDHVIHLCMQALWPKLRKLEWMHSASAGLEHLLFPALVDGAVVLTNAKARRCPLLPALSLG